MFNDAVITDAGIELLSRWSGGGRLTIDGAEAGTGTVATVALMAQTSVSEPKQALPIVSYKATGTGIEYNVQFTAAESAYTARQIGIYAHLDDDEQTLLALFQDTDGMDIPSRAEMADFVFAFYATLQMSNTGEIHVTVDTSALASGEDVRQLEQKLDEYISGGVQPHASTHGSDGSDPIRPEDIGAADAAHTHNVMIGATYDTVGVAGFVPAPGKGADTRYLRSDGKWIRPPDTQYNEATESTAGLMSADDKAKLNSITHGANGIILATTTDPGAGASVIYPDGTVILVYE